MVKTTIEVEAYSASEMRALDDRSGRWLFRDTYGEVMIWGASTPLSCHVDDGETWYRLDVPCLPAVPDVPEDERLPAGWTWGGERFAIRNTDGAKVEAWREGVRAFYACGKAMTPPPAVNRACLALWDRLFGGAK